MAVLNFDIGFVVTAILHDGTRPAHCRTPRLERNFALSDKIRDDLKALGVQLMDGKDGEMSYVID